MSDVYRLPETNEERAFWSAIGSAPEDQLPRLVFADWLEERAGVVECLECEGLGWGHGFARSIGVRATLACPVCTTDGVKDGTGRVPDGRADLALALRATADRVPLGTLTRDGSLWGWYGGSAACEFHPPSNLDRRLFDRLTRNKPDWDTTGPRGNFRVYDSPEAALRDLCRAWCVAHAGTRATV